MASMDNKNTNYTRPMGNYGNNNMYGSQYGARGQTYGGMHNNPSVDLAALAHGFQGMNLQNQSFAAQTKTTMMNTGAGHYNGLPLATVPANMYGAAGQYVFPSNYGAANNTQPPNMYTPHATQYMPQMGYQGYQHVDNSPQSQVNWTPTTGATACLLYTSPSPRDGLLSRMPSSA